MTLLNNLKGPADLRTLKKEDLDELAVELITKAINASVVRGKELAQIASKPDNN